MAKPDKIDMKQAFQDISESMSVLKACQKQKVSQQSFYDKLEQMPELKDDYIRARERRGESGRAGTTEGYGLSHIIRCRTENSHDGIQFVRDIPSLIKYGKLFHEDGAKKAFIETADKKSVISLDWLGDSRVWLLTAYFKDENKRG